MKNASGGLVSFVVALCLWSTVVGCGDASRTETGATIVVGTKNFTEQFILGELMAQLIEARTDLSVERRFNLGGTMICHGALVNGEIDLYPEYTGTALTAILRQEVGAPPDSVYRAVSRAYRDRFDCDWLAPFGFNNTYAITVRQEIANAWRRIEDLRPVAAELTAGFTAEFSERPDGYPGLTQAYGFEFGRARDLDPGLMYRAATQGEVDVICAFATDGRIPAYKLFSLQDNRGFFPPYFAAPVVRSEVLVAHPELRDVLDLLGGILDDGMMQGLNYSVDESQRDPADVAREFLTTIGLLRSDEG